MNKLFQYTGALLLTALTLTACSEDTFDGANANGLPVVADYADNISVSVDQETNTVTFNFTPARAITPVWIIDGSYSSSETISKYYRKKGIYTAQCKVKNANGISDGAIEKTFTIDETRIGGFEGFKPGSDYNLFKGVTLPAPSFYYANADWSQRPDPQYTYDAARKRYTLNLPDATYSQWQAQMAFEGTGIATSAGRNYDFSVILWSPIDLPYVKVKVCQTGNDNVVLFDKDFKLEADEPKTLWGADLEGVDISDVKVLFDFGGNPDNTVVRISDFVLKDHADDDGTEVPDETAIPFNYDDEGNIWKSVDETQDFTETIWFGDANWQTAYDQTDCVAHEGNAHTITIPADVPAEQWHGQWKIFTKLSASASDVFDISAKVKTSGPIPVMTFKLTDNADDGNYFCAESAKVPAGDYVFRVDNAKLSNGADAAELQLVIDVSGAAKGTVVTVSEIAVIKK